jgi:hypothetical protein
VLIERQTVIILDLDRLRECAEGLPHVAELPGSRDPAPRFLVPPGPG